MALAQSEGWKTGVYLSTPMPGKWNPVLESHLPLRFCKPPPALLGQRDIRESSSAHSDQFLSFFPTQSGNPTSWPITAVTSPLSFLMKVNCMPIIVRKKFVSDSG